MPIVRGKKIRPIRRMPKASSVKKIVKNVLAKESEKKFINTDQSATVANWDGQVVLLSGLALGTTPITRVGRKIKLSSLSMKYQWDISNATDNALAAPTVARPKFVRMIIFRDKLGDGTAPTAGNVLQTLGTASAPLQHLEFTQIDRWSILHDKVYTVDPGGDSAGAGVVNQGPFDYGQGTDIAQRYNKFYKKFKNLQLSYQGDTAAQADVLKNHIYCLFLSDQNTAAVASDDARARLAFSCRIRFTDD